MDEQRRARINRLKWHCRRALLELDLVFQRYWARVEAAGELSAEDESLLERLLELEDHELWALVSGKEYATDPRIQGMVERLRTV